MSFYTKFNLNLNPPHFLENFTRSNEGSSFLSIMTSDLRILVVTSRILIYFRLFLRMRILYFELKVF